LSGCNGEQNPDKLAGISWGLRSLDEKTGGLKRGELFILAGRPGMGKSALAECVAGSTASAGEPTFLSSLEMGDVNVADRILADQAYDRSYPIVYYDIAAGNVSNRQAERLIDIVSCTAAAQSTRLRPPGAASAYH
jgi:replicative DNA helicase